MENYDYCESFSGYTLKIFLSLFTVTIFKAVAAMAGELGLTFE